MEVSYRDSSGRIPIPEVFEHDGTTFVCLNSQSRDLPQGILNFERTRRYPRAYDRSGVLLKYEWTKSALWFEQLHAWEAWIPKDAADTWDPYVDLGKSVNPLKVEGKTLYTVPPTWAHHARTRILELQRCCLTIRQTSHYGKKSPLPYFINFKILSREYDNELDVEIVAAAAKRCILDGRGFLSWWMLSTHNWTEGLDMETVELMASLDLLNRTRRGVIINLPTDWRMVNIGNLVAHDIPVYYPWTAEEANNPRFSRFNPGFLQYYHEFLASTDDLEEVSVEDVPGLLAHYPSVLKYDDFGQAYQQDWDKSQSGPLVPGRVYHPFIMDFEEWKPRPIISPVEAELCEKRYHYRILNGPPENIKLFWRFRPSEIEMDDGASIVFENDEVTVSNTRETYRSRYAPLPGQVYDIETGKEVGRVHAVQEGSSLVSPHDTNHRHDEPDAMIVDDQESTVSGPSTSNGSLGRPYERRASNKRKKAKRPKPYSGVGPSQAKGKTAKSSDLRRLEANLGDELAVSRWVARMSDSTLPGTLSLAERLGVHAPSVTSSLDSSERIAQHAEEERRSMSWEGVSQRLKGWIPKFIVPSEISDVCAVPASCRWNNLLFERGILIIPKLQVAVMMRLLANTTPGCNSIQKALTLAIEHGFEFQIYIRQVDVALFRPTILSPMDYSASVYYAVGFQNPELTFGSGGEELYGRYKARVMDVLRRPHARAFVGLGGPLSWIARKYGGQDIVRQFMNGPSVQVTVHQKGKVDITNFNFAQTDEVSPEEKLALLGHVKYGSQDLDKWMYPPPGLLLNHLHHYHGDWNPATEHMVFDEIYEHLEDGTIGPKTESGWRDFLRFANRGENAPNCLPTRSDFSNANTDLKSIFGRGWSHADLKDLIVPEPIVNPVVPGN